MKATPEELPFAQAVAAFRNILHLPDESARRVQQEYADDVNGLHDELTPLATTPEQAAALDEEIVRYKQNYLKRFGAYLAALARCASSFITGPANFPVAQQRKRHTTADNRMGEFLVWRKTAREAIRKRLLDLRTPDAKEEASWQALRQDIAGSLREITAIDEAHSLFNRASFVNSIAGKIERLACNGEWQLVDRCITFLQEYDRQHRKPAFTPRHKVWTYPALARLRCQQHDAALARPDEVLGRIPGVVELVTARALDRLQLCFPGKPTDAVRDRLRSTGWKWSPFNSAWQRQLTEAAIADGHRILKELANGLPAAG